MAVTKLSLYNDALTLVGERLLSSDTEDVPSRYTLDAAYLDPDAASYCLELVKPKFALLTAKLASPATPTNHGLAYEYSFPADYISLYSLFSEATLQEPIDRYLIEKQTVACAVATNVWLRYISDAQALTVWTPTFANVVTAYIAKQIAPRWAPQKLAMLEELFLARVNAAIQLEGVKELPNRPLAATFTLTADYLNVYNGAMTLLGKQHIFSNADESEERVDLDAVIDGGAVNYLYEVAKPRFALETNKLTAPSVSTEHGLDNVFTLPADYLSFCEVHADELMDEPISRYLLEARTIATEYSIIYLRFVSSSPETSDWTPAYKQLLSAYLADQVKNRFVESAEIRSDIRKEFETRLQFLIQHEGYKEVQARPSRSTATLDDTWRKVYNKAFFILGLDEIVSNDDDSLRRSKADVCVGMGLVNTVLEDVGWKFGVVSDEITYDPSLEPGWGYKRVYRKPAAMHRLDGMFQDAQFSTPLKYYEDEGDYWYCSLDTIYVKYISTTFLTTPSSWPQYFTNLVAAQMAVDIGPKLAPEAMANAWERLERYEREAQSTDAMSGPPQMIKSGGWVRARASDRRGSYNGRP